MSTLQTARTTEKNQLVGGFSGGSVHYDTGVKKTTDFVEKLTWGLAISLVVLSLVASMSLPGSEERGVGSRLQEKVTNSAGTLPQNQPANVPPAPGQNQPGTAQPQQQQQQQQPQPQKK